MKEDMKTLVYALGRFITPFNRKFAVWLAFLLALLPALFAFGICVYFEIAGWRRTFVYGPGVAVQFFWALNTGVWWDEKFPKHRGVATFPKR